MRDTISLVLFSGTEDKLHAAATMAAGAAVMGTRVNVFLQFWALESFQADRIDKDHGVSPEAGPEGAQALALMHERGGQRWPDLFRQAAEVGEVEITACAHSMEMFGLDREDLDPMVQEVRGIAAFMTRTGDGPVVFI